MAVVLTLVQAKQIRINVHKRNSTKTQYKHLMLAIPKCLTHIKIYNDVSVKYNKTLLCLLLY